MNSKATILLATVIVLSVGFTANATLTFDMGTIFDGPGVPYELGPWVSVSITDTAADTVELTISVPELEGNEKVSGVYLNLDPILDATALSISKLGTVGSFDDPQISTGQDDFKADGDGLYDIRFDFNTDTENAFNGGEAIVYTISLAGLSEGSFDYLSAPGGGNGPFKAAAHIISLGEEADSAWITVPEPATMFLLGLSSILLRKRK